MKLDIIIRLAIIILAMIIHEAGYYFYISYDYDIAGY
jgi:hypothetical protein